jgi:hypothetical protein
MSEESTVKFLQNFNVQQKKYIGSMRPYDLVDHLRRQYEWSLKIFGPPNANTAGIVDHIKKELVEVENNPEDVLEWIDIVILAFDGALRNGWDPLTIAEALRVKQEINESRTWPDWRTAEKGKAICHIKNG